MSEDGPTDTPETGVSYPARVSVPTTAAPETQPGQNGEEPLHTAPLSVVIGAVSGVSSSVLPALFVGFSVGEAASFIFVVLGMVAAIAAVSGALGYISWKRFTYTVGRQDIRVESGVLSRSARSVPYERIQDVSLEQKLIPRLFGLVSVKFETGAGGGEDLSLSYLTVEEGERLRQLVRERRDSEAAAAVAEGETPAPTAQEEPEHALFSMDPRRLFIFGTFEFSLAVFAVLAGLLQYADGFAGVSIWNSGLIEDWVEGQGSEIVQMGIAAQVVSAILGLIAVFVVGSVTGLLRTFVREWDFLLERTARGFRRRRGLFTKTDVVMPIHRVQGLRIGTGMVRYRFGWHNLRFVSLAQDAGASSHVVAPFAKMDEIAPIVEAAGFHLPDEDADWHKASKQYRNDSALFGSLFFFLAAIPVAIFAPFGLFLIPIGMGVIAIAANFYAWEFHRHAIDADQIMATRGLLSPSSQISTRLKLHSVEIAQDPVSRWRGYATLHLGLAGGQFSIPGVPLGRAREVRREVMKTIAATDFSQLERA
ncbi:MAG: PH domain-containing protein [Pseudomonadota bacterium]